MAQGSVIMATQKKSVSKPAAKKAAPASKKTASESKKPVSAKKPAPTAKTVKPATVKKTVAAKPVAVKPAATKPVETKPAAVQPAAAEVKAEKPASPKLRILTQKTKEFLLHAQKNEFTESIIYANVAKLVKDEKNRTVLEHCSAEEKKHGEIWQSITGVTVKPNKLHIFWYTFLARLLGYTFTLKLMEGGEHNASPAYEKIAGEVPEAKAIAQDETKHEAALLDMLDEERLQYVGSMVLGLSDALVELTGTLAGLTFAVSNLRYVALSGLITGIAAALSMTSSAYLSEKADGNPHALKSCLYTGGVYFLTVIFLILPYLLLPSNARLAAVLILAAIVIIFIAAFMFYVSVAKGENFWKKFGEMAVISISVAILSFALGLLVKLWLGIDA
jgi:VIT1/CCC1 family predicted Fe2+/Mn2+ transporter